MTFHRNLYRSQRGEVEKILSDVAELRAKELKSLEAWKREGQQRQLKVTGESEI